MKRSSAMRHLRQLCDLASDHLDLRQTDLGWPLEEIWVAGELLDHDGAVDEPAVVLLVAVPPAELPWLAEHPAGEWVGEQLRLGKRPVQWWCRPAVWPAWNPTHRRVARIWSAAEGSLDPAIDAIRSGGDPGIVAPTTDDYEAQLRMERRISATHLRQVTDDYWEPDWRRQHRGGNREDILWRAAAGLLDIDDALATLHQAR